MLGLDSHRCDWCPCVDTFTPRTRKYIHTRANINMKQFVALNARLLRLRNDVSENNEEDNITFYYRYYLPIKQRR